MASDSTLKMTSGVLKALIRVRLYDWPARFPTRPLVEPIAEIRNSRRFIPLALESIKSLKECNQALKVFVIQLNGGIPPSVIASVGCFKMLSNFALSCLSPTPINDGAADVPVKSSPWHSAQPSWSNTFLPLPATGLVSATVAAISDGPANSGEFNQLFAIFLAPGSHTATALLK